LNKPLFLNQLTLVIDQIKEEIEDFEEDYDLKINLNLCPAEHPESEAKMDGLESIRTDYSGSQTMVSDSCEHEKSV
jgi:hypothetical protein